MAVGLVIYPLLWGVEGWLVWRLAGLAPLLVFLLLLAPSGLLALAWRERLGPRAGQAQAFLRVLADRDLHRRPPPERRAPAEELRPPGQRGAPEGFRPPPPRARHSPVP